jgi:beta-galactosidase
MKDFVNNGSVAKGDNRRQFLRQAVVTGAILSMPDVVLAAVPESRGNTSRDTAFDGGWKFHRGDVSGAEALRFDDRGWRTLDLPHDWSIEDAPGAPTNTGAWEAPAAIWQEQTRREGKPGEFIVLPEAPIPTPGGAPRKVGPFDADGSEGSWAAGWTIGGTGWYRKRFNVPRVAGEQIELRFDGVYQNADVWLNGVQIGAHDHGHAGFVVDCTPHLAASGENVVAVRVRNLGLNSRWYNGSGIYRHVWLSRTPAVRIPANGIFVTTPQVGRDAATVRIAVEVQNRSGAPATTSIHAVLRDEAGRESGAASRTITVAGGKTTTTMLETRIATPRLWSPNEPVLYDADVTVAATGMTPDQVVVPFGIRSIAVDAKRGLTINGTPIKLKGACIHHDHGIIGVASFDHAEVRKVTLLKANGFNAIRCSHNIYAPAFYDACDRLGMIVIDETFDVWEEAKFGRDLGATRFKSKWKGDVAAMVRLNRNHPSIIFWSIGNEIPERNNPEGVAIAARLREAVLELDDTRLITAALAPLVSGKAAEPSRRGLDVVGYNYMQYAYEADHAENPDTVFMGTEQFAQDIHDAWRKVERYPWLIGDFVWTAMDYIGEVGAGGQQLRSTSKPAPKSALPFSIFLWDYPFYQSGCGEIDLIGLKKPQSWYRDVLWGRSPVEMLVRRPAPAGFREEVGSWGFPDELKSWTWPGATAIAVRVYTVGDEVRLMLDGREVARTAVRREDKLIAELPMAYRPGKLTAVAYREGVEIGRQTLETVGKPAMVRLKAERNRIAADASEIAYVYAEVCDAAGRVVPDAQARLSFAVSGQARLLAAGSANPRGIESFTDPTTTSFHGVAQAILRPTGRRGEARVAVSSPGLKPGRASINFG